tara:strand:+ start:116 stop:286 length:171 start_codon:yes stop_codon:yes gene_type:complete
MEKKRQRKLTRQTTLTEFGMKLAVEKKPSVLKRIQDMMGTNLSIKSNSKEIVGEEE